MVSGVIVAITCSNSDVGSHCYNHDCESTAVFRPVGKVQERGAVGESPWGKAHGASVGVSPWCPAPGGLSRNGRSPLPPKTSRSKAMGGGIIICVSVNPSLEQDCGGIPRDCRLQRSPSPLWLVGWLVVYFLVSTIYSVDDRMII
jgi:hypothetical protein